MNKSVGLTLKQIVLLLSKILTKMPATEGRICASAFGASAFIFWSSERKRIINTLDRIYFRLKRRPPATLEAIVKRNFIHFSLAIYELLNFPRLSEEGALGRVSLNDTHQLEKSLSKGKGVILALPHIGNWELLGAAIAEAGYPVSSFFLSQKEDELGNLLDYFRSFTRINLFERDKGLLRALRVLKNGEILGMIADQDGGNKGVYTNFLAHWVSMPSGPAVWSIKTGAEVVPVFCLRESLSSNYTGVFMPSIKNPLSKSYEEKVIEKTKTLSIWMQELILTYPEQYLWFYDRFKPRHQKWLCSQKKIFGQPYHGESRYNT